MYWYSVIINSIHIYIIPILQRIQIVVLKHNFEKKTLLPFRKIEVIINRKNFHFSNIPHLNSKRVTNIKI